MSFQHHLIGFFFFFYQLIPRQTYQFLHSFINPECRWLGHITFFFFLCCYQFMFCFKEWVLILTSWHVHGQVCAHIPDTHTDWWLDWLLSVWAEMLDWLLPLDLCMTGRAVCTSATTLWLVLLQQNLYLCTFLYHVKPLFFIFLVSRPSLLLLCLSIQLTKAHRQGHMVKVDWLDRLTFREIEMINEVSWFQNRFVYFVEKRPLWSRLEYVNKCQPDCFDILFRNSWCPEDKCWFSWSPDAIIMRLTLVVLSEISYQLLDGWTLKSGNIIHVSDKPLAFNLAPLSSQHLKLHHALVHDQILTLLNWAVLCVKCLLANVSMLTC